MKKIIFLTILALISTNAFSTPIQPVAVLKDSVETVIDRVETAASWVQSIQQAVSMVDAQLKTFESLSQGDFESFAQAMEHQTDALSDFNELTENLASSDDFAAINSLLDNPDFKNFSQQTKDLEKIMESSTDLLWKTSSLMKNSEYRMEKMKDLHLKSQSVDSTTGQLQLLNENLSLVSQGLSDVLTASVAANHALATIEAAEKAKKEAELKEAEQWLSSDESEVFESKVSNDEMESAIFGGKYRFK